LAFTHTFPFKAKPKPQTINTETKGTQPSPKANPSPNSGTTPANSDVSTYPSDNKTPGSTNPQTPTTEQPLTPTGNFVSAHHNIPQNASLASSCVTSAGATCEIVFTKDGVTKSLPTQKTDSGGGTYWQSWKPQDIGLTPGSWHITARATLGNQTSSADDAQTLDIAS